jgi:hypothetical protein
MGFACDCVPSGQSQDRQFLRRKELLEARISIIFDFHVRAFSAVWLHFPQAEFWAGITSALPAMGKLRSPSDCHYPYCYARYFTL